MRSTAVCLALIAAAGTCVAGEGDQDLNFGNNGLLVFDGGGTYDRLERLALQSTGKIIGVGTGQSNRMAVGRFNPDGTVDTTFANNGRFIVPDTGGQEAVLVLPDDRILLGYSENLGGEWGVGVLTPDGQFDNSFGTNGFVGVSIPNPNIHTTRVAVGPNGNFIVGAGGYDPTSNYDFYVGRFTPDGQPDTSFGGTGFVEIDFARPEQLDAREFVLAMAVRPDGRILVGGHTTESDAVSTGNRIYALAQLNTDGSTDDTFGEQGKVVFTLGTVFAESEAISDIILLPDGSFICSSSWNSEKALLKFNANGSLDTTWGNSGVVYPNMIDGIEDLYEIRLDGAGRILAVGRKNTGWYGMARLFLDGTLDPSFSRPNLTHAVCFVQQPGGGIIVGGRESVPNVSASWNLRRVFSDPIPCSPADLTTTAAEIGDPEYGVPDGTVTSADLNFFVNAWFAGDASVADLTSQNAPEGTPGFGIPDGAVTAADVQYFVNIWLLGCP